MTDIIIPIYNALEYVQKCVSSVIGNTDLNKNGLILINDKSTEENISLYLKEIKELYPVLQIHVIENEENLGFVKTVNKGMKFSKNDVILLNSDTEVAEHWLDGLVECAYSEMDIATVTALSNNATLVSVPKGLQPNELPSKLTFSQYANLIWETSFKDYPQIPTAHGFCMFIKRKTLNTIGFFDEEAFGKGYGEENDFSYRCLDYGLKHVLCDNVIVYHKESMSFQSDKKEFIEKNAKILEKRYPVYYKKTESWCEKFPINYICKNITYNLNMCQKKNVLILVHDWKDIKNNVGGTSIHCMDLIKNLRDCYNFHVFAPENGIYKLYSYFEKDEIEMSFDGVDFAGIKSYYNKDYKKMVENILRGLNIDVVHIHHMLGHFFDVIDSCKKMKIKSFITLHDFYCLCPTINLLYMGKEFCLPIADKKCDQCLQNCLGIKNNIITTWINEWSSFLEKVDVVITPSNSTKEIIETYHKNIQCNAIEHGIDTEPNVYEAKSDLISQFNIAFVGVMAKHKGSKEAEELINSISDKRVQFHLFGDSQIENFKKNKSNYCFHGKYKREELPKLLQKNNINLVCNLSVWPETYSYTLTETIAAGIPVLSYDIGAVGERIKKYGYGWVVAKSDGSITKKILEIVHNPEAYKQVMQCLKEYEIKTTRQMAKEYDLMYDVKNNNEFDISDLHHLIVEDRRTSSTGSDSELEKILNSARWRYASKIKIPEFAKRILKKVVN